MESRDFPTDLPGFDLEYIRKTIGLDGVKLKRLLDSFCDKFADSAARLRQLIQTGNRDQAARWLHDLKGAAGVIGAAELSRTAAHLEETLTGDATNEIDTTTLSQALDNVLQTASRFHSPLISPTADGEADWAVADKLAKQLRILLEGNDFVPHELITLLKDALPSQNIQPLLFKFEKQINTIDYQQAEKTLANVEAIIRQHIQTGLA
jgi:HPt (histidine-containing phosphotransfer) domain-containing protein